MHPKEYNLMKKTFILLSMMLIGTWMNAQSLYAPLQRFADACIQEKEAILSNSMDESDRFELLYTCLQTFVKLPLKTGDHVLNPSNNFPKEILSEHIVFSPAYIDGYLQKNMTDTYSHFIPYIPGDSERAGTPGYKKNEYVYYNNSLIVSNSNATFSYNISAGEQQLILIAEDDTPLEVEITSEAGTSILIDTNTPKGFASQIWHEENPSRIHITVRNPTDKHVSFVIAVY